MAKKKRKKTGPRKRREKPIPRCKAILLCERVIVDELTRSATAVSIFNAFLVHRDAQETEPFFVYLHLVGGIGSHTMGLEIIDLSDGKVFVESDVAEVTFRDRISVMRLIVRCPPLPVKGGSYDLVVVADGRPVENVSFRVELVDSRQGSLESEPNGGEETDDGEEDQQEESDGDGN